MSTFIYQQQDRHWPLCWMPSSSHRQKLKFHHRTSFHLCFNLTFEGQNLWYFSTCLKKFFYIIVTTFNNIASIMIFRYWVDYIYAHLPTITLDLHLGWWYIDKVSNHPGYCQRNWWPSSCLAEWYIGKLSHWFKIFILWEHCDPAWLWIDTSSMRKLKEDWTAMRCGGCHYHAT